MSSWRDEQNGIPPWNERPKCHCGFCAWLQVWEDRVSRRKKGCRYFKCPGIDDDFKVTCTFIEWIDTRPLGEVGIIPVVLETKAQYYGRLEAARDEACLARLEQERCICQQQIHLKGKEDELQRQRDQLEERQKKMKKQEVECSTKIARKGKLPRFT
uniref:Zinc finger GRF-type domain-containing protein n=1 Tax=Setaria viridis TaxID=4556 RepID=A0A4U6UK29_SETVI|nr:hypothetical protein SEVIR_5G213600v2 [Setaria viridis]